MIVLTGKFVWQIGHVRVANRDNSKVFEWLSKYSPLSPGVMAVSFSYAHGWSVEILVPIDQTAQWIDEKQCATLRMLGKIPIGPEYLQERLLDFVSPYEEPASLNTVDL